MCRCVRDADRLDSLKPHYTVNDISTQIEIENGTVNLQCTRFKTRIRASESQVRLTLHIIHHIMPNRCVWQLWCDGNISRYHSTSDSRPIKAISKDT